MAKLRVFLSSTCYDLGIIRSELRPFISSLGYEPVMSDFSDILYDPRSHTHDSCIKEIPNCDMVILVVGSRFGGTGVPSVINEIDFSAIKKMSSKPNIVEKKDNLSITQLEVLKAVEQSVPVYAFVEKNVMHDHHVFLKNRDKPEVIKQIVFPSIHKKDTALYIFEFIEFLSHRTKNNSITSFARLEDIKGHLLSQWSQLFQRLLYEDKSRGLESKRYRDFSERLEDLKAVVLASIATPDLRETARAAVQFRHLIVFVSAIISDDVTEILVSDLTWEEVLVKARVKRIETAESGRRLRSRSYLVLEDGTFFESRYPPDHVNELKNEWAGFMRISVENRRAVAEALLEESNVRHLSALRYRNENYDQFIEAQDLQKELDMGETS